jgi:hypothetical protein
MSTKEQIMSEALTKANRAIEQLDIEQAEKVEPFEIEWPDYHPEAMGCGLEDRNITDRYEAMQYGWNQALDHVAERLPEKLYTHPPIAPAQPASIEIDFKQATELLQMFGGEPTSITLLSGNCHSGKGLYASYTDMPEEGAEYLGEADDEAHPPTAPAQPAVELKPSECWPEDVMQQWDWYRKLIASGDKGSEPRDWFESLACMRLVEAPAQQPLTTKQIAEYLVRLIQADLLRGVERRGLE